MKDVSTGKPHTYICTYMYTIDFAYKNILNTYTESVIPCLDNPEYLYNVTIKYILLWPQLIISCMKLSTASL